MNDYRIDEIADMIASGELSTHQVFTQMHQLIKNSGEVPRKWQKTMDNLGQGLFNLLRNSHDDYDRAYIKKMLNDVDDLLNENSAKNDEKSKE